MSMMKRKISRMALFICISLFSIFFCHCSIATDTLTPAEPLVDGKALVSAGGSFALVFFCPGVSRNRYVGIRYNKISLSVPTVVWVANRRSPIPDSTGSLKLDDGGALTINTNNSKIVLFSPPASLANPVAQLLDNGNFVVKEANSTEAAAFAWQSFDYPTDTLLPGMKLGWNLKTGLNRNLTSWQSDDDPSPGRYVIYMDINGDPQLIASSSSSTRKWRSGPWNGNAFCNIPEMTNYSGFTFTFVNNQDEIYYMYDTANIANLSIVTRLLANRSGMVQRFVWIESTATWSLFWYMPRDRCDEYSTCGPYGLCSNNNSPMCSCLQGFQPKSPREWALRVGSAGCVRSTALNCRSDGFMTVSQAVVPDTTTATVDMSINLDECGARCLRNCSCTGYASAKSDSNGSGCIMWTSELVDFGLFVNAGQDLYVRLASADLARISINSNKKSQDKVVVPVIVLPVVILTLAVIVVCSWIKKRRTSQEIREGDADLELPLFHWDTIIAATGNFAADNLLGEGGFGPVFKGKLIGGQEIAVKKLSKTSVQGVDEFRNEVILIAKLQHRNLVQLLGHCIQGDEKLLVYEFMPNNSLDTLLFDTNREMCLDWRIRYDIIVGIARGLLYLHQDSRFRIIHRDLKASNILLDSEMNPKISDFGLARIFGGDKATNKTRKVVGTYGYMSPEYAMDGIFSVKSDVFSFGVLVLEIISGKRNRGVFLSEPNLYLLGNAWSLWNEGRGMELLDPSIGSLCPVNEVMRCMKVGLLCVQEKPEDRPTMSSVILMLGSDASTMAEPKPPGFVARILPEENLTPFAHEAISPNYVTVTTPLAR